MNSNVCTQLAKACIAGLSALTAQASLAAIVTITTPSGENTPYTIEGDDFTEYPVFANIETGDGIVDPSANGGEELILLGLHETIDHFSNNDDNDCVADGNCNNIVTVDLVNLNDSGNTGDISLVLTAAEDLIWHITTAATVNLKSIYIFGANASGQTISFDNGATAITSDALVNAGVGSVDVNFSNANVCAFSYPDGDVGCSTRRLLGTGETIIDSLFDYLGDETDMDITSFNGTEFADGFTVAIDSNAAAIPLPAAFVLYLSGIAGLMIRKRQAI